MRRIGPVLISALLVWLGSTAIPISASPTAVTYYVSSSAGNDNNNDLSEATPFATIAKVNALN